MSRCFKRMAEMDFENREGPDLLGLTIHEIAREWKRYLDGRLGLIGLSDSRWRVLKAIGVMGRPVPQKDIADFLGIEGPSVVRSLDHLERDGWVRRESSEIDRRVKFIHLQDKAMDMLDRIGSTCFAVQEEVFGDLEDDELSACHKTLLKIRTRIMSMAGKLI